VPHYKALRSPPVSPLLFGSCSRFPVRAKFRLKHCKRAQQVAFANLLLKLRDKLDGDRYAAITTAIQEHGHSYPLLRGDGKGGKFTDLDIERYLGNFEDIGYFLQEGLIIPDMAYHHFSYDAEKAWCNDDVKRVIRDARKSDKSATPLQTHSLGGLKPSRSRTSTESASTARTLRTNECWRGVPWAGRGRKQEPADPPCPINRNQSPGSRHGF
jgi:hypothetical protein